MIITTLENIPGKKYEIIKLVAANRMISFFSKTEIYTVENKLIIEATALGADAVVGVRVFNTSTSSTTMYGTTLKLIK